jgi:hypothetical protein
LCCGVRPSEDTQFRDPSGGRAGGGFLEGHVGRFGRQHPVLRAATCAIWFTPQTRGLPRRSSSGTARTSSSRVTSALLAAKDHVNVFLYGGAIVSDREHVITGGHDNTTARTVASRQGERLNAPALLSMFKQIIADNRAGGWRKLKTD